VPVRPKVDEGIGHRSTQINTDKTREKEEDWMND